MLTVVYAIIGAAYIAFVFGPSISQALDNPLTVTLASLSVLVAITLVNFIYLLMQIVMAAEDCGVLEAVPHVARLLRRRTKELAQVLAAILALMLMATGASILATTALGLIAFVPFVGLAALPLQVFAWLVRGVVFQFVGLTGVATYLRLHFALQSATVEVHTPSDGFRAGDARVTFLEGRAATSRNPPSGGSARSARPIPGLISLSAGYPAPDVFPWDDLAVDHRADPGAPRRQHAAVRRDARLPAADRTPARAHAARARHQRALRRRHHHQRIAAGPRPGRPRADRSGRSR